ncbi:MAG: hypothetical protein COA90_04680 [Gammaproteobacteria bacterium]|nr:MAG: hypothetical protein COA90_04680 [Gammaproteobacteria bacterium]
MSMFKRIIAVVLLLLFLTACVSNTKNISDTHELISSQGLVVTKIHSNWQGYDNPLLADLEFTFVQEQGDKTYSKFVLSKANDLKVVALPEGNYMWLKIVFGNYYMDLTGGFTVGANQITYIGDINSQLDLSLFSMSGETKISDETSQIKDDLQLNYPTILDKYGFKTNLTNLEQY